MDISSNNDHGGPSNSGAQVAQKSWKDACFPGIGNDEHEQEQCRTRSGCSDPQRQKCPNLRNPAATLNIIRRNEPADLVAVDVAPNAFNPIRARIKPADRPRSVYITFSTKQTSPSLAAVKHYFQSIFQERSHGIQYHLDLPKEGWVVLPTERDVTDIIGDHHVGINSMHVKRFFPEH